MLISVHVPKTAGTSLASSLERVFGDRLLRAYGTRPLSSYLKDRITRVRCRFNALVNGRKIIKRYDAIHGHFVADSFDLLPGKRQYCIFLRRPEDRVISHYLYWEKHQAQLSSHRHSLWEQMIQKRLSINEFASLPQMVNFYSIFLGRKRIEEFDFVGLTEEYEASLLLFEKIFGIALEARKENLADRGRHQQLISCTDFAGLSITQERNRRIYDSGRRRFEQLCREYSLAL